MNVSSFGCRCSRWNKAGRILKYYLWIRLGREKDKSYTKFKIKMLAGNSHFKNNDELKWFHKSIDFDKQGVVQFFRITLLTYLMSRYIMSNILFKYILYKKKIGFF